MLLIAVNCGNTCTWEMGSRWSLGAGLTDADLSGAVRDQVGIGVFHLQKLVLHFWSALSKSCPHFSTSETQVMETGYE